MDTPNTTASYISHANFEEPVPLNYRDEIHVLLAELILEGRAPEFKLLLGPQIELAS
jgi:hypothetical protein